MTTRNDEEAMDLAGVHGRARTCDLRIRNPLLFRLLYVDPGAGRS